MTNKLTEYERNEESASRYEEERIDYLFEKFFEGTELEKNCDESHPIGWRQSIFRWTFASGYRRGTSEDPKNRDVSIESQGETVTLLVREIANKDTRIAKLENALLTIENRTSGQCTLKSLNAICRKVFGKEYRQ